MRKKLRILLAMLTIVLLFTAGCGGSKDAATKPEATDGNKQLIMALDPDYETFDPGLAYEVYALLVLHPVYDTLMQFEDNLDAPVYGIAESHEVSQDGLSYTFKLREGIKFSGGNPLTAQDVKWSVERSISLKGNGAFLADGIKSIETPDAKTVVFNLKEQDASFLTKLTYNAFGVIDSKVAMEHGATNAADANTSDKAKLWFDTHSAGSGPYVIESYTPKVEVVLARNQNYWGEAPYYDKVVLKAISDPGTQLMMLEKGDIDIAFNLGPEHVKQIQNKAGIEIKKAQAMTLTFLLMNRDPKIGGPIANPDVQKAIRLVLDYQGMQTIAGEGSITPVAPFQVGFLGTLPPRDPKTAQDVEKAKELMKKAGYEKGFKTTLEVATLAVEGMDLPTLAQKIQNDLLQIGIETEIKPSDIMVALDPYRKGTQALSLWYWGPDYPDPNSQLAFLPGSPVGLRANWTAEMNPKLADLGKKAAVEVDKAARIKYLEEIQTMMDEDSAFNVLLQHARHYATRDNIQGTDYIDLYKINLKNVSAK
ncbi:ABC transporter substrate-binding protein [Desulfosporosinus youngiae]|uniref:ABC-type dipeptide transport system, periplasmic component n=1 Tax=Desulfosporosinus youngiae DSM 17734 TaxID=768710 RepID=H5Y5T7_9FIRM|nr:ABC transporter substrate-binding protein [Desulfosporosinus youngiae]EHQ90813.1 ABC-type dipeptide transport system, periplasmic component [Desulfosporosinus youngiae DSM 17734]